MDNRTRNLLTGAGLLILVLGLVMYYMYSVVPHKQQVLQLEKRVSQNEQLIAVLESKKEKKVDAFDTNSLQRRVPVKPLVDQFILDLNRAELLSQSNIQQMNFVDEVLNMSSYQDDTVEEASGDGTVEGEPGDVTEVNSTPEAPVEPVMALPEGIQKVNVSMAITSDNYPSLREFLLSIEGLPRMAVINGLTFSGKPESEPVGEGSEVAFTADVSTFYIPTLLDLAEQTPTIDYPEPADKDNPLYETVESDEQESASAE